MVIHNRTRGLLASLLVTTALAAPGLALAQQVAPAPQDDTAEVDEVIVTGQRAAQRAAIAVKRSEFG